MHWSKLLPGMNNIQRSEWVYRRSRTDFNKGPKKGPEPIFEIGSDPFLVIFYGANCVLNSVCPRNLFAKPHKFAYIHAISKNIRVKYSTHPSGEDNDKSV
jgi:hypothetical protein